MKDYLAVEQQVANLLSAGQQVYYQGQEETIVLSGKVKYQGNGEGKTDVYVLLSSGKEIKISCKKSNADFVENKLRSVRAKQIFGENCSVIREAIIALDKPLKQIKFYDETHCCALLGFRCDILNKNAGCLTSRLSITPQQIREIYFGAKLDKKGMVNGNFIPDCGVANTVLLNAELYNTPQEIINHLCDPIEIKEDYYITLRKVNYYINASKYEHSRTLALPVNWANKEHPCFDVENSMNFTSTDIYKKFWRN